jgi:hypothetical protein
MSLQKVRSIYTSTANNWKILQSYDSYKINHSLPLVQTIKTLSTFLVSAVLPNLSRDGTSITNYVKSQNTIRTFMEILIYSHFTHLFLFIYSFNLYFNPFNAAVQRPYSVAHAAVYRKLS